MVEDRVVVFRVDGWCGWMCFWSENMENVEGWVRLREGMNFWRELGIWGVIHGRVQLKTNI